MSTVNRTTAQSLRRFGFTFATDGSHAACLAAGPDGGWHAETWRLPADGGRAEVTPLPSPGGRAESLQTQLVALPDGRVLACRRDGVGLIPMSNSHAGSPDASSSAINRPSTAGTYTRVPSTATRCSTAPISRLQTLGPSATR